MRILLKTNVLHNGDRILAGKEIELSDDVAKKFIAENLAIACQIPASQPAGNDQSDADEQGSDEETGNNDQPDVDEQGSDEETGNNDQPDVDEQGSDEEQSAKKSGGKKGK